MSWVPHLEGPALISRKTFPQRVTSGSQWDEPTLDSWPTFYPTLLGPGNSLPDHPECICGPAWAFYLVSPSKGSLWGWGWGWLRGSCPGGMVRAGVHTGVFTRKCSRPCVVLMGAGMGREEILTTFRCRVLKAQNSNFESTFQVLMERCFSR